MNHNSKIFEPLQVRNTVFRNRIFGAPILPFSMLDDHTRPSEAHIEHLVSKARGGVASVTVSGYGFRPDAEDDRKPLFDLYNMVNQRAAARLADGLHSYGAVVSLEAPFFNSHGYTVSGGRITGAGTNPYGSVSKGEMPEEIMNLLAEEYAEFAALVQELGFDMMMFHFAHGNTFSQFLSPFSNKRTDRYGGSLENRARFPLMIIDRVRKRVGKDFLLEMRVSGDEMRKGGITIDQTIEFLKMAEGKIDIVQMSTGGFLVDQEKELLYPSLVMPSDYMPDIPHIKYAKQAKDSGVKMVIGAMGAIQRPDQIEEILERGAADVVYLARGLIAEPELPTKAYYFPEKVRPCIKCYHCVDTEMRFGCSVNPLAGREIWAKTLRAATTPRKVAVVGGGPAGMNAAIAAARFGHRVTLFEKAPVLGGRIIFGDKMEFKRGVGRYRRYLIDRLNESGAEVRTGTEATKKLLAEGDYDWIIVAIGAQQPTFPIPGAQRGIFVADLYEKDVQVRGEVAVIGGGFSGVETAVYLARRGHKVTLLEQADVLCGGLQFGTKHLEYYRVAVGTLRAEKDITAITGARVQSILPDGVVYEKEGQQIAIHADTVVMATGLVPRRAQAVAMIPEGVQGILVGDCKKAEDIEYATRTGFDAAVMIR